MIAFELLISDISLKKEGLPKRFDFLIEKYRCYFELMLSKKLSLNHSLET